MAYSREKKKKINFIIKGLIILAIASTTVFLVIIAIKSYIKSEDRRIKECEEEYMRISELTGVPVDKLILPYFSDNYGFITSRYVPADTNSAGYFYSSLPDTSKIIAIPRYKKAIFVFEVEYKHTFWGSPPKVKFYPEKNKLVIFKKSSTSLPDYISKIDFASFKRHAYIIFSLPNKKIAYPYFSDIIIPDFRLLYAEELRHNKFEYKQQIWGTVKIKTVFY